MSKNILNKLLDNISCRDNVINNLYSLIGHKDEPLPANIFVHGHIATGKSLVIETMIKYLDYKHSIINCIEHSNVRHIYDYILMELSSYKLDSTNSFKYNAKCDNFMDFINNLKTIFNSDNNNENIIIVLDKCERLRDIDLNVLNGFMRLQELTNLNICIIMISDVIWEKYRVKIGAIEPLRIHFSQYTKDEMSKILLKLKNNDYNDGFYMNYLNLFLSVFYRFCRDINELRYMANINFLKYIEPIKNGTCNENNITLLWRNISNVLKTNLEVIYLRVSSNDFHESTKLISEIESTTKLALSFELPYYAKYMLIAAYLASYNPVKEDKRLFLKISSKKKKTKRNNNVNCKKITFNTQCGPKNFAIDRMLAIFCTIIDEKIDVNANLLAQIPTMCQLGLLAVVGDATLDEPKFKCCINLDFVTVVAKTVGFNIKNYLYDFNHH
ncbi:origin recognition complex subunit 5 [Aphidius gifuensis]|uniref:origin recognition complex subunit 5 n=1 Tax=Aphidius gifuensis TaxID=684658 RepID=UPI001CDC63FD|nr:origin recognition complex subunit 5 [Aphidius gifuensis]